MYDTIEHRPTHPPEMDLDHWNQWLDDLATTEEPQARGHLAADTDDGLGHCCLGRGCKVAGIQMVDISLATEPDGFEHTDPMQSSYAFAGATDLAPAEFAHWLGLDDLEKAEVDITVAWPMDTRLLSRVNDADEDWPDGLPYDMDLGTAANLNDKGRLTFAQIADVLRYFGTNGVAAT